MPVDALFKNFQPPDFVGRYELKELLGFGGMGAVYRAKDPQLGRWVAIKFWLNESVGRRSDFFAEARLLARLNHPGVVQVFDVVDSTEHPAIVMEYVPGMHLDEYVDRFGPGFFARLTIASSIVAGLVEAHSHGVVHRDLKLANVLVTPAGETKITDFGIAGLSGEGIGDSGLVLGSLYTMSPEQLRDEIVDERSDLFSLGCVLYWLFAGRLPVQAAEEPRVLLDVYLARTWPALDRVSTDLPPELCGLVDQLLAFDPSSRPQSAMAVLRRIEELSSVGEQRDDDTATFALDVDVSRTGPLTSTPVPAGILGPWHRQAGAIILLVILAAVVYQLGYTPTVTNTRSVALIYPTLQNPEHVRDVGLMKSAVYKAVADGMESRVGYRVVMPQSLPLINATPTDLARALAVDELIYSHLDCAADFCNISLRRRSEHDMLALSDIRISLESYVLMHRELVAAVGRLYADTKVTH
ncbi:MAG: hypothetical protein ACI9GW_000127 [Halieaceae bacterium]|jgi:hypothetical protein